MYGIHAIAVPMLLFGLLHLERHRSMTGLSISCSCLVVPAKIPQARDQELTARYAWSAETSLCMMLAVVANTVLLTKDFVGAQQFH